MKMIFDFKFLLTGIILLISFIKLWIWYLNQSKIKKLVDKIPGPKSFPFIGTTYIFFGAKREEIFDIIDKRSKPYPYIHRIWTGSIPEVRIYKAEHVETILSSSKHIEKSHGYNFLHPWLGLGLLTSTGDRWFSHRKIITPTFHFSILEQFSEVFREKSDILVKKLEKYAKSGEVCDVYPYITRATLDIICETAMGTDINAQEDTEQLYVKSLLALSELTIQRLIKPWYHSDFIYNLSANGKKWRENNNIVHGFTDKVINERKRSRALSKNNENDKQQPDDDIIFYRKKRLAFLDLLLETNEKDPQLTDKDIREEVDTFMFEGHDTTTAGISWALYLIGNHEHVQDKIYDEIKEIFDNDINRTMTIHDLNKMKYLERVIKETLRLYPSVGFIGRKLFEDIKLDDYVVPKECAVALQIYHLHRDPRFFPDPEKFDPDRFLPENTVNRHPYAYTPFSAGPRNCIGQKFAILEEKAIISSIIRKYKIKSLMKYGDKKIMNELILRPKDGIELIIQKREN